MKRSQDDISNAKASEIQRDASRQEQTAYKLSASQIHSFSPSEMQNFVNSIKNSKIQLRVVNPASLTSKDPPPPTSPPLEPLPPKPTTQITSWLNSPPPDPAIQTLPLHTHTTQHTTNLVNFPLINKKPKRRKRYHIPLRNIVNYNNNILYDNYTMDNLTHNNNNNDIDIPFPSSQPTNPSPEEETTEPTAPVMSLPSVNEDSLDKLLDLVSHCHTAANREKMSAAITRQGYIRQLLDLFIKCEQARNLPKLQCLFNIFKSLIMLNETSLLEFLFSEEYMLDVIGALEYDPELKKRIKHREFLKEHAIFKQVVPIRKAELITRIHQTFRLQYLKDVVLPRQLDDTTFSTINSLIFFNQVEIVSQIQSDDVFLSELFALLKQDVQNLPQPQTTSINNNNNAIPQESQPIKDRILFVQELCTLAKNLHVQSRLSFFETLYRHGVCDVLQVTVLHQDTGIRLATVNILDNMATHDSGLLRSHILAQKNETPPYQLLMNVIKAFLYDHESGIRVQLNDIIRSLLDVANIVDTPEKDEFLNVFYIDPITTLLEPFNKEEGVYEDSVKENICDILSFCVQHHGYRIKYFILGNNIVPKILNLLKRKEKHLVLAAIRFFRTFVGLKDDFYNRHVTKFNLFDPIMQTFKDNGPRYNLINSAIIELLEFIRKENIKHLILHIAEHYKPILSEVTYVETCKLLLLKAEQLQEATTPGTTPVASKTVTPSRFQTDEEDYFKEDDQEPARPPNNSPEQGHAISTRPKLVDYDDIDIDDSDTSSDNEPPPTTNGPRLNEEENSLKRKEVEAPSMEPPIPKPAAAEDEADTTILKKKPKISINIKPVTSTTTESEPTSNSESESNSPKKQDT